MKRGGYLLAILSIAGFFRILPPLRKEDRFLGRKLAIVRRVHSINEKRNTSHVSNQDQFTDQYPRGGTKERLQELPSGIEHTQTSTAPKGSGHSKQENEKQKQEAIEERKQRGMAETQKKNTTCKELFLRGLEPLSLESNNNEAWMSHQCDNILCNSTTASGACQWSLFAIDILLENATRVCDPSHVQEFFVDPPWETYRFADYVKGIVVSEELNDIPRKFPDSIIAAIEEDEGSRRDGVARIVTDEVAKIPLEKRPTKETLVIHLRLGDVIDGAVDSVRDLLFEEKYFFRRCINETNQFCPQPWKRPYNLPAKEPWNKYVKPLFYYSSLEGLNKYKSVIIMGSAHLGGYKREATKSCHYTAALTAYLQRRMPNANVTLRLGRRPDDDIVFAALATNFIQGGGGFSFELGWLNRAMKSKRFHQMMASRNEMRGSLRKDGVIPARQPITNPLR